MAKKSNPNTDINPEDHQLQHSGLAPKTPISNQGADDYDLNAMRESPTRSGLQPKGSKKK